MVRTKFRLSIVLRASQKMQEATKIKEQIASDLESIRATSPSIQTTYTDEDDMKLLDFGVCLYYGRTAGMWSNGTFW